MSTENGRSGGRDDRAGRPTGRTEGCSDPAILERLTAEDAEEAMGRMLGHEIGFALTTVAAGADTSFPDGSLAARVRELYEKRRSSICKGASDRARSLLRRPVEERRRLFGSFAEADAAALGRCSRAGDNPTLAALVRRSVGQRVQGLVGKGSLASQIPHRLFRRPRTSVEAFRAMDTELEQSLGREVSMVGSPDWIGFRWVTAEPEAEELHWTLFELGSSQPIASGTEGPAPGGSFSIDFRDHLPAQPAKYPRRYVLSCQPWIGPKIHHLGGAAAGGGKTVKEPAQAAGAPAPLIRIVYSIDESFGDFDFAEVYRTLELYVDSITMVEDQHGPGSEEFWISGTVQEIFAAGTQQQNPGPLQLLRTKQKTLEPEPGARASFGNVREHGFHLNNPDPPSITQWWPRHYVVTLTIWEADGGDEVAGLLGELNDLLNDYIENDWADAVLEVLDWLGIELEPQQVTFLTATLAAVTATTILSAAAAAAAFVVGAIVADLGDDYYGTKVSALKLLTSEVEGVQATLTGNRAGTPLENGDWRLATDVIEFKGAPGALQAAGWDGIVELRLHWEATGRELL